MRPAMKTQPTHTPEELAGVTRYPFGASSGSVENAMASARALNASVSKKSVRRGVKQLVKSNATRCQAQRVQTAARIKEYLLSRADQWISQHDLVIAVQLTKSQVHRVVTAMLTAGELETRRAPRPKRGHVFRLLPKPIE